MRAVEQFVSAAGNGRGLATCLLRYRVAGWNGMAADAFADVRWSLARIRDEHGDVPVVLVGHSMGGMTIMGLAALRPELFGPKVAAVALISTSSGQLAELTFGLPELLTRVRAAVFPVAAWTMRHRPRFAERTRRLAADVVSVVTRSLSFASADVDPALAHYVDSMIAGTPVDVIAEFYPALAGLDETGSLEPLRRIPTLVLTGDKDKMIPMEHSELIVERLAEEGASATEYVVDPDAGHLVLLEKPDEVTEALTAQLRRDRAGTPGSR
jgi:pimeloyl-ACP methyl ester carboxylesterase